MKPHMRSSGNSHVLIRTLTRFLGLLLVTAVILYLPTRYFRSWTRHPPARLDLDGKDDLHHSRLKSPFALDPSLWADDGSSVVDVIPSGLHEVMPPKQPGMLIPNSVHTIFLKGSKNGEMAYWQYLALRSILINLAPEKLYLHCDSEPWGVWWDAIKRDITLDHIVVPNTVYGQILGNPSHKSDVIRILTMRQTGGIYLDLDIFVVRPFDELMYDPMTMGLQGFVRHPRSYQPVDGPGSSVFLCQPGSAFLTRWLEGYKQYNPDWWDWNAIRRPWISAKEHPEEVTILDGEAFFQPNWDHVRETHEEDDFDWDATEQYTYHAWHQFAKQWLDNLTPEDVLTKNTSFNRLAHRFMGENDQSIFARVEKLGSS